MIVSTRSMLRQRQRAIASPLILAAKRRWVKSVSSEARRTVSILANRQHRNEQRYEFSAANPAAASALLAATALCCIGNDSDRDSPLSSQVNASASAVKCDAIPAAAPAWTTTAAQAAPPTLQKKQKTRRTKIANQPRNVLLHRMRSVKARHLGEKYNVDWQTVLGEGAYGSVHPARIAATGEKVALKKISKRYTNSSSFKAETDALLRIYDNGGHPNISGLRDIYEDYSHFYLIVDLVSGGEMFEHLINYGAYSEADAARLMQEVASALAFIHGVGVVHGDLKPENLLLCSKNRQEGTIKMIDFGCATVNQDNFHDDDEDDALYDDLEMRPKAKERTAASRPPSTGTAAYWPPERFLPGATADPASDMWAVGIILYIMLTGVHPFDPNGMSTDEEIENRIQKDPTPPLGPEWTGHLSPSAVDLIKQLMAKDPKERLTAADMLQHPWVSGETASTDKIKDSDKKLSRFKDLRDQVEAGIFAVLVNHGHPDANLSEAKPRNENLKKKKSGSRDDNDAPTHIMKRAFEVFDNEGKGFVSPKDLERVVSEVTGSKVSASDTYEMIAATLEGRSQHEGEETKEDKLGLSLTDFQKLFSGLKHKHFPRGHVIFHTGDQGDAMYFLISGKVEIKTKKGKLVSILRHGDFFGEGSLLDEHNLRYTCARCATPVDVIKIKREDFNRYIASSTSARSQLKIKWRARSLNYAKNLIRLQTNVKKITLKKGDVVYREGDEGTSMYMVDDVHGGDLEVKHGGNTVHYYHGGDSFGESSLLYAKPRSSTVTCISDTCRLQKLLREDFLAVVESSPEMEASLRDMCRKRLFKKAVKALNLQRSRGFTEDDLVQAFHDADIDKSGRLSLDEIRQLMHTVEPNFPESELVALLKFIDVDEDAHCNLEEFKRLFRVFEKMESS